MSPCCRRERPSSSGVRPSGRPLPAKARRCRRRAEVASHLALALPRPVLHLGRIAGHAHVLGVFRGRQPYGAFSSVMRRPSGRKVTPICAPFHFQFRRALPPCQSDQRCRRYSVQSPAAGPSAQRRWLRRCVPAQIPAPCRRTCAPTLCGRTLKPASSAEGLLRQRSLLEPLQVQLTTFHRRRYGTRDRLRRR